MSRLMTGPSRRHSRLLSVADDGSVQVSALPESGELEEGT